VALECTGRVTDVRSAVEERPFRAA
jgi:hypothetical protein